MRAAEKKAAKPIKLIPLRAIFEESLTLTKATKERLSREWPRQSLPYPETPVILESLVLASLAAVRCVRHLGGTAPSDGLPHGEAWLAFSPVVRSALEVLATTMFLLDDIPTRTDLFLKAGWRFKVELHERLKKRWKGRADKTAALQEHAKSIQSFVRHAKPSALQQTNPRKIPYWPGFSDMKKATNDPNRKATMGLLHEMFYAELSSAAHSSWYGSATAQALLTSPNAELHQTEELKRSSSLVLGFHLMTLGEINATLGFAGKRKIRDQLDALATSFPDVDEICAARYWLLLT